MSIIKTKEDLENLRYSCKVLMSCHHHIKKILKAGISASKLNDFAIEFGEKYDAKPNFLGYKGFPHSVTVSINDEVVHGFASPEKIIPDNSLVKLDMGFEYKGMHSDAAKTYIVGKVDKEVEEMVEVTKKALWAGISKVKAGVRVGDIGSVIDRVAVDNGYGNVKELTGHGLGYKLHDDPYIPNFGVKGKGVKLFENKLIAIEPMFILGGDSRIDFDEDDGWTVTTRDGTWSAHEEHDVLVTKDGCEVLTDIKKEDLFDF